MILLHIITNSEKQAIEISDLLIDQKLVLEAVIFESVKVREKDVTGKFQSVLKTMVIGKTKALLFNHIDDKLRKKYKEQMPVLYSVPIVNMDWEQSSRLISEVSKV